MYFSGISAVFIFKSILLLETLISEKHHGYMVYGKNVLKPVKAQFTPLSRDTVGILKAFVVLLQLL